MDRMSKARRSALMAQIRSKDTKPELRVRHFLHAKGLRYRVHDGTLPGTPDIVLRSRRIAVFVHGCFWHGHISCPRAKLPATRKQFWRQKISRNRQRDRRVQQELKRSGWQVLIVWGCQIHESELQRLYQRIARTPQV